MVKLISVFLRGPDRAIRAIVKAEDIDFWMGMGAYRTEAEIYDETPKIAPWVKELAKGDPDRLRSNAEMEDDGDLEFLDDGGTLRSVGIGDADKGFGKPGSYRFHELRVLEMERFETIKKYVFDVTGSTMRQKKSGTTEKYRKTALMLIRRHINGGKSG